MTSSPSTAAASHGASPAAPLGDRTASTGTGRASGKAIVFGEHAAVFGHPAIAMPLRAMTTTAHAEPVDGASRLHSALYTGALDRVPDRLQPTAVAVRATLEAVGAGSAGALVRVESDIPAERGVGSSAAVAAAIVEAVAAAYGIELDADRRHALIQTAERAAHGRPSGLDARAVVATAPVWFEAGRVEPIAVGGPLSFVIADSGVRGRTREAVAHVGARRASDPATVDAALDRLGALSADGRTALASGDVEALGAGMDEAHALLDRLGVSDPALDALVGVARRAGAAGAKLTGGGRGGCVLVLARDAEHAAALARALRTAGAPAAWTTDLESTR
jgi:mevalonate kinase